MLGRSGLRRRPVFVAKIDRLKLYPPGPDARGWVLDDEKNTYPLFEVLRRHGIKNVCVHKGLPGIFIEEYCHTDDLARAASAFPDLNFIAFHSSFPWEAELAGHHGFDQRRQKRRRRRNGEDARSHGDLLASRHPEAAAERPSKGF